MGENEWLNGYLEAILDVGNGRSGRKEAESSEEKDKDKKSNLKNSIRKKLNNDKLKFEKMGLIQSEKDQEKIFSPTKYFVGVVNSFEEADLHRTWIKVIATRNSRERNYRLENMCWRMWHLSRKKKQIIWDDTEKLVSRRLVREKGRTDAAENLSELSEGEKEKIETNLTDSAMGISRIQSDCQI